MSLVFTAGARGLGLSSAVGTVFLGVVYVVTLGVGLLSLQASQQPVGDPWFSVLEILILVTTPLMVALMEIGRAHV